jgi:hypothetical protein
MRNYPRWADLKHFNNVATLRFTDAEQYVHVLKVRTSRHGCCICY